MSLIYFTTVSNVFNVVFVSNIQTNTSQKFSGPVSDSQNASAPTDVTHPHFNLCSFEIKKNKHNHRLNGLFLWRHYAQ